MERRYVLFFSIFLPTFLLHGCGSASSPTPDPAPIWDDMDHYNSARSKLVARNAAMSFDANTVLTSLEQKADALLVTMRNAYITKAKDDDTFAPSKFFPLWDLTAIQKEPTFQFLDGLPKGADLHTHSGSTGSVDWFLDEGLAMDGCYLYWPEESDLLSGSTLQGTVAFYNASSKPAGYFPCAELMSRSGFRDSLRSLWTATEALHDMDSLRAWEVFGGIFARTGPAMGHRPFYLAYLQNSFEVLFSSGITHMEMRALIGANGLGDMTDLHGNTYSGRDVIATYQEALSLFQASLPPGAHFSLKLIASDLRTASTELFTQDLEVIMDLHEEFPNFVVGLDSVSQEDPNHRTLDYVPALILADARMRERDVTLPLYLHDGESQNRSDANMIDAVLLGCPRVGHAINTAAFFPAVREEAKARGTVFEISPISNQILRYVESIETHPGAALALDGVNIVIANDDPMIFGYTGVTWDWWAVTMGWQLDLKALKTLAKNSLLFSALNSTEKDSAVERWEHDWQAYLEQFVKDNSLLVSVV